MMHDDIKEILVTKEQIESKTLELANAISKDYEGKNLLLLGLLKGSVPFMAELMKTVNIYAETEYMAVSSYGHGTTSSGVVTITKDIDIPLEGKDILIVEDIIDTGNTLSYLKRLLQQRNPKSVKICTLLDKPDRRKVNLSADYVGFVIPDEFVIGYGLDYDEKYRAFDEVYILKREVYEK